MGDTCIQGVTFPRGFCASGIRCGIKTKDSAKDLAMIYSERVCNSAGVFTQNVVKAAPVLVTSSHLRKGKLQAIVANSGNANACTGEQGVFHAGRMAELTAQSLGIDAQHVKAKQQPYLDTWSFPYQDAPLKRENPAY